MAKMFSNFIQSLELEMANSKCDVVEMNKHVSHEKIHWLVNNYV